MYNQNSKDNWRKVNVQSEFQRYLEDLAYLFHRDFKKMNSHAINGSSPGFLSMQQAINYKREAHNNFPYILSEEYTHCRWRDDFTLVGMYIIHTHTLWSSRWKIDWLNRSQPREFWRVDPLYFFHLHSLSKSIRGIQKS